MSHKTYIGINKDPEGAMNASGNIVRDAWVFGLLPETEDCEGWSPGQFQGLYEKVYQTWEKYGHLPSLLPPELKERHARIYGEAVRLAQEKGWDPDKSLNDDH